MFIAEQYRVKTSEYGLSDAGHLRVEVKHRCSAPNQYTWEIFRDREALPVEESFSRFGSWEEASQAGKQVLKKLLASEKPLSSMSTKMAGTWHHVSD
jgi:hypothetical protein